MPKRSKPQLEPIDIDEMLTSPAMNGLISVLSPPPPEWLAGQAERDAQKDLLRKLRYITDDPISKSPIGNSLCQEASTASNLIVINRFDEAPTSESPISDLPIGDVPIGDSCHTNFSLEASFSSEPPVGSPPFKVAGEATPDAGQHPISNSLSSELPISDSLDSNFSLETSFSSERPVGPSPFKVAGEATPDAGQHPISNSLSSELPISDFKAAVDSGDDHSNRESPLGDSPITDLLIGNLPTARRAAFAGRRMHKCTRVQDAHSSSEQRLYEELWKHAKPETAETRLISASYQDMSQICGLHTTNCRKNVLSLIEKLAVEVASGYDVRKNSATIYRIRSYKLILQMREEAGLTCVFRTCGVRFVDPSTGDLIGESRLAGLRATKLPIGNLLGSDLKRGSAKSLRGAVSDSPISESLRLYKEEIKDFKSSATTDFFRRVDRLLPGVDRRAVDKIWTEACLLVQDATEDEILFFFEKRARLVYANKRVDNPIGLLLSSIPDWFEPRRVLERRSSRELLDLDEPTDSFRRTLSDPEASEAEKRVAMQALQLKT